MEGLDLTVSFDEVRENIRGQLRLKYAELAAMVHELPDSNNKKECLTYLSQSLIAAVNSCELI